jgi:transposase
MIHIDYKLGIDTTDQRLIGLLLKGYANKNIALHENSSLSTIQRRIRWIYENGYVIKKNELNYKKLAHLILELLSLSL